MILCNQRGLFAAAVCNETFSLPEKTLWQIDLWCLVRWEPSSWSPDLPSALLGSPATSWFLVPSAGSEGVLSLLFCALTPALESSNNVELWAGVPLCNGDGTATVSYNSLRSP